MKTVIILLALFLSFTNSNAQTDPQLKDLKKLPRLFSISTTTIEKVKIDKQGQTISIIVPTNEKDPRYKIMRMIFNQLVIPLEYRRYDMPIQFAIEEQDPLLPRKGVFRINFDGEESRLSFIKDDIWRAILNLKLSQINIP